MFQSLRKFFALFLFVVFSLSLSTAVFAEASGSEKSVTGFFRRLFNWGPKTVQNTGEMTANVLNNTGEKVLAPTGENTASILTGDIAKTGDLIAEPVVGTLETTGQAGAETAQAPVKAVEEEHAGAEPAKESTGS